MNDPNFPPINSWQDFVAAPLLAEAVYGFFALLVFGVPVWFVLAGIRSVLRKAEFVGRHTVAGTAEVLSCRTTGTVVNNTGYVCKFKLRVQIPGRDPYDVTVKETLDVSAVGAFPPGTTVPVQVIAAKPRAVRINFKQPVNQVNEPVSRPMESSDSPGAAASNLAQIEWLHEHGKISDADFATVKQGYAMKEAYARQQQTQASGGLAANLLATGQRVPGVLMAFAANGDSTDSTYSLPELRGAPFYLLTVELHVPNLAPLRAQNAQPVPPAMVPKLAMGLQVSCAVDPANPAQLFAIDWNHNS